MSAASALEYGRSGDEVILFEKNPAIGKKILITGGGRCNVTTGIRDIEEVLKKYPRGGKFLSFAMHEFSPLDMYKWVEKHNVKLKIEMKKGISKIK
jgi:predicted flavoprotein YhiN